MTHGHPLIFFKSSFLDSLNLPFGQNCLAVHRVTSNSSSNIRLRLVYHGSLFLKRQNSNQTYHRVFTISHEGLIYQLSQIPSTCEYFWGVLWKRTFSNFQSKFRDALFQNTPSGNFFAHILVSKRHSVEMNISLQLNILKYVLFLPCRLE